MAGRGPAEAEARTTSPKKRRRADVRREGEKLEGAGEKLGGGRRHARRCRPAGRYREREVHGGGDKGSGRVSTLRPEADAMLLDC